MVISSTVVDLSRFQFALTALYHFLFVPLTIGLAVILAIMETVYVLTKREIWKQMVKYWGILFGINFALGVATGITMEFQFGTNWAYYAHFVGDVFGAPLAIEGLMAFFLEATFVGLFFFGWKRLSPVKHLLVTWLLALGTNLSALWILIANGWMQYPVGSYFNFHTMRMEVSSFSAVFFNTVAQAKFVHTVSAAYVTGSLFVLAISAYLLLRGRAVEFAKRSMAVAISFGLAASLAAVVLGDESGYLDGVHQKMKIAAMEAMWHTEKPPASLTLFGIPEQKERVTKDRIAIPFLLGLIATRSIDEKVYGIYDLVAANKKRVYEGIKAYSALQKLESNPNDQAAKAMLKAHSHTLGYAFLLKRYTDNPSKATPKEIDKAAWDTVPEVAPLFWAFRVMVACGFYFILLFAIGYVLFVRKRLDRRWFLRMAFYSLPLPWLASEMGWFVAEFGRQPWVVDKMLPTFMGTSSLEPHNLWISLGGFVLFYTLLAIVELYLMVKYIRLGPDGLRLIKASPVKESQDV